MARNDSLKAGWLRRELKIATKEYSRWPPEVRLVQFSDRLRVSGKANLGTVKTRANSAVVIKKSKV